MMSKTNESGAIVCSDRHLMYRSLEFISWAYLRQCPALNTKCNNPDCDGTDPQVHYLATCVTKRIHGIEGDVPNTRACPSCGILVEHVDKCKHMTCTASQQKFCFVCLKISSKSSGWSCGRHNTNCEVTLCQTALPGDRVE
jgi:hypothetical protein